DPRTTSPALGGAQDRRGPPFCQTSPDSSLGRLPLAPIHILSTASSVQFPPVFHNLSTGCGRDERGMAGTGGLVLPSARFAGAIVNVPGIRVGHASDLKGGTGVTVLLCEAGAVCGLDVRGGGSSLRNPTVAMPGHRVEKV